MTSPRRQSLPTFLAGCATGAVSVVLCAILALAANALYWTNAMGISAAERGDRPKAASVQQSSNNDVRAAVAALPAGNAAAGAQVFESVAHCNACHALGGGSGGVGPALDGIGARAATARDGYSAEAYLFESIVDPGAYVADGQRANIMPGNFGQRLSAQQLADLIAYLTTR